MIYNILVGQFLAILGVATGIFVELAQDKYQFNVPLIINSTYYFLLFLVYLIVSKKLIKPKLYFILIAIFDSQANFMCVYAFSVTHFNLPFIINFSSLLWTLIFSVIFIKTYKYTLLHWIGVLIICIGILESVLRGMIQDSQNEPFNYKGLLLCIGTSICYAG